MSRSARPSVYKIGRITSLLMGLVCCVPALARAQEAAPADAATPAVPAPATAAPPPAEGAISPEVARRLDELDQRSRITERKLELAQEAAAQKVPAVTATAGENGFGITSADKQFEVKFHALLQMDGRRIFGSDDALLRDRVDTFILRRVRPILDATLLGLVDLRITPDFGNNTVALYDAYGDVHPAPWLRLRAGKFKPPVGLERLQTDNYVPFVERSLDSNLSAQRDVGAELWGDIANAAVHYEIAILNGNADGTITDIDDEHAKSYAGRLFLRPFQLGELRWLGDLGVGFAVETGNEKGSSALTSGAATNTWLPSFKSESQQSIFSYVSSTTDPTLTAFSFHRHTRWNPQLYYYVGPVGVLAEWVKESQGVAKGATTATLDNQAGHVTASVVLFGDETYDGPRPYKNADWATKSIGAIELAARYSWLSVDEAAFTNQIYADESKSVREAKNWAVSVNWWLSRNLKIAGTWEQTTFTGGAGTTKLVTDRPEEKTGFARLQVAF